MNFGSKKAETLLVTKREKFHKFTYFTKYFVEKIPKFTTSMRHISFSFAKFLRFLSFCFDKN